MFFLLIVKKKNEFSVINIARVQNAYMYVLCMYVLIVHISNTPIRVIYIQKKKQRHSCFNDTKSPKQLLTVIKNVRIKIDINFFFFSFDVMPIHTLSL